MRRAAVVLLALLSTSCLSSVTSVVRSSASHERQSSRISERISEASTSVLTYLGLGKCSRAEAALANQQLVVARTLVDGAALGLTTAVLGLGRQSRVTADLSAADGIVESVEKLLRGWSSRASGPANDVPLPYDREILDP